MELWSARDRGFYYSLLGTWYCTLQETCVFACTGGAFAYFLMCFFVKCVLANTVLALELRGVGAAQSPVGNSPLCSTLHPMSSLPRRDDWRFKGSLGGVWEVESTPTFGCSDGLRVLGVHRQQGTPDDDPQISAASALTRQGAPREGTQLRITSGCPTVSGPKETSSNCISHEWSCPLVIVWCWLQG